MARQGRLRPVRWLGLVVVTCCCMLLVRQNAGVFATTSEDDDNAALSPSAAPETAAPATGDLATESPETGGSAESPTPAPSDGSSEYLGCLGYTNHIKDGYCDTDLNNAECGWDGGDCCACTCGSDSDEELAHPCGQLGDGYDCLDPDVPDDCGVTPSPAAAIGYPDCEEYLYEWQDGVCDDNLNTATCGYDGGDCCRCTCRDYNSWGYSSNCGYYGYDCMDPDAPSTCSTDSPTPSPAAGTDWPECEGYIYMIGDGSCQYYNNNEECGWDGGDCCPCTCEGSSYYSCSSYSMDCQDPNANCITPSPTPYCPWASDGYCDSYYNTEDCDWDGGDCCAYGCSSTTCLDPIYGCDSITTSYGDSDDFTSTFITYATSSGDYGSSGCFDGDWAVSDGKCDSGNNNVACDYDGGDCCECDCYDYGEVYECGVVGYYCLDQTSLCYGSTSEGNFDSDDYYDDRGPFSFTPTPVVVTEELSLPTYSEMSVSKTELGGILALSFWGFCMLGCGAWAACGVFRKKVFGEEEEKGGGSTLNRTSLNAHQQRRPRPSTERGRYSVKSRGGRRSSPSRPPLDATVAAALALPGDNRHATPTYNTYDDPAVVSRSANTGVEETKGESEVELGRMFRGGRSGGWDETKTEEAHGMFASSNGGAAEPGDRAAELGGGTASVDGDASVDGALDAGVATAAGAAAIAGDDRQASPANNVHQDPVAVGQESEGAGVAASFDGAASVDGATSPGAGVTTAAEAAAIPGDDRQASPANKTHQDPAAVGQKNADAGVEETEGEGKAEPGGVFHSGRGEGGGETKSGEEHEKVAADVGDVDSNGGAEDLGDGAASVDGAPSADVAEAAAVPGDDAPNVDAPGGDDDIAGDDVSATSDEWSGDEVDAGVREVNEVAVKGAKLSPLHPPSEGER